ncbi:CaiB/BaiF CoA transferase family protein [Minwuia thermotolerans]|uniref:CoA transferase n=1 Tax=Minwuia thermotolerans TaxID=2056226 RepID=A0A2M9G1F7_9PROT|nr:CoA transferase [Minwuia thermotolerans]PJK29550.1 CoA transferase [Minwuia thermotolerans]
MSGVLSGYRVLDFGRYIAGPYCASLLAEFGADVIRIEKLAGSEDRWTTPVNDDGIGALFLQINRNKRGLTLNPMKPEGREIVKKLVETADVVVANLPPQGLKAMGLDYDSLKAIKPDIVLTTVSAFGHGGPYSDRVGFDGIGQVMSGSTYMSGSEDQPVKFAGPWVDFTTAMMSAIGTLVALMHRKETGEGQMVEGALVRSALTIGNAALIEQAMLGINRKPTMNRGQTSGPSDIVPTKDGWFIVQVVGRPLFERWAKLVGRPDLIDDPRFADDLDRGNNSEILSEIAREHAKDKTTNEVLAEYAAASVPAGPLYTPQQTLDDPHVQAMGFLQDVEFPNLPKPAPVASAPINLSKTPGGIRHRAPVLGEHTEEILGELGYGADAIAEFRDKRIV